MKIDLFFNYLLTHMLFYYSYFTKYINHEI